MPKVPRFGWRTWLASTTLAAIAAAMVLVFASGGDGKDPKVPPATFQLDPEVEVDPNTVTFTDFDGKEELLTSLKGTPTVINFFASTCTPCITEMPELEQVHQQLGTKVAFLGLAVADRIEASQDLIRDTGITYRTARDPKGLVLQLFQGTGLPVTVLLDADGNAVSIHQGQVGADELRSLIAEKLGITP